MVAALPNLLAILLLTILGSLVQADTAGAQPSGRGGPRPGGPRSEAVAATPAPPERVREIAEETLRSILEGIREGDYSLYSSRFTEEVGKTQTREAFLDLQKSLQKKLGSFKSVDYLGFYLQSGSVITLFKARFSKERDDVLIKLVLEGNKPSPSAVGLWFDSPRLAH